EADAETWEKLHQLACAESSTEQKHNFYRALAVARSSELASRTLALAVTDELIPEDAAYLVRQVSDDGEQPALALEFAMTHLDALLAKVGSLEANSYVPKLFRPFTD